MVPAWRTLLSCSTLLCASRVAYAENYLRSTSFDNCESSNQFNASTFNVSITPDNRTIAYDLSGESTFSGNDTLDFSIIINGKETSLFRQDPCSSDTPGLCPSSPGQIVLSSNIEFPERVSDKLPKDIYTASDLDAQFRLSFNNTATGGPFGCIEAKMANGVAQTLTTDRTSSGNDTSTMNTNTSSSTNGASGQDSQSKATTTFSFSSFVFGVSAIVALTM